MSTHIAIARLRGHGYRLIASTPYAVRENIESVFQADPSALEVDSVCREYIAFKKELYLWSILPRHPGFKSSSRISIVGLEHLEEAIRQKRGVILITAHLGYPHIIPRILEARGYFVRQLIAELDRTTANEARERWLHSIGPWQRRIYLKTRVLTDILYRWDFVASLDVRPVVSALKNKEILMIAGDGLAGTQFMDFPLLGKQYPFPTGYIKIALMTKAIVIPAFAVPISKPAGIQLQMQDPLRLDPKCSLESNVYEFARILDGQLRRTPHLWTRWRIPDWFDAAQERAAQVVF